ncbi:elicitin-like protein [Phytophthora infestans T30-4]|uniref:Elicitin-like protein n=1 Tax=Phytophthora infestans (strain T30-4) TaxID=403677 RepID=D0P228_PHYIT|nr:elicitin-like protein [Phytophthora infestans T30-4]EEY55451.1 elicitin-like protein [Phytophthora infestans T30-4]|eukprot:XP_002895645.1 elicitin-like protein [Phytophthora infestans T30-4]
MEQVGEQLLDCTVSGVNNKIEVQSAMTACNGEDLIETDAPFVLPPTAAPLITIAPIVTSAPFQTLAPLSSLAPRPGGDSSGISGPATEPPASTDGSVDWSIGSSTSAGSGSTINCTNSKVSSLVSLYTETAKSSPCTSDATRTSYSITIFTKCASSCASKLETLASDLPNCVYAYESSNKKTSLQRQIKDCTESSFASHISTTVFLSSTSSDTSSASSDFGLGLGRMITVVGFMAIAML